MTHELTDFEMAVFMFTNLATQTENWGYAVKDRFKGETKHRIAVYLNAAKALRQQFEKHYDMDQLEDDSECFSRILELILKAPTPLKKMELYTLLREYQEGAEITITRKPTTNDNRNIESDTVGTADPRSPELGC